MKAFQTTLLGASNVREMTNGWDCSVTGFGQVIIHGVAKVRPPDPALPEWTREGMESTKPEELSSIRVAVIWDERSQKSRRKLGADEFPDDAALEKAISEARDSSAKNGKPEARVVIEFNARIPWDEVVKVVNIVKLGGIDRIEFTNLDALTKPK